MLLRGKRIRGDVGPGDIVRVQGVRHVGKGAIRRQRIDNLTTNAAVRAVRSFAGWAYTALIVGVLLIALNILSAIAGAGY